MTEIEKETLGMDTEEEQVTVPEKDTDFIFSVHQYDTHAQYMNTQFTLEQLIEAAQSERPFIALRDMGEKPIDGFTAAKIEQSDKPFMSVDFDLDNDTVQIMNNDIIKNYQISTVSIDEITKDFEEKPISAPVFEGSFINDEEKMRDFKIPEAPQSAQDKVKEITDRLEAGLKALFEGDNFKNYLNTMSKFHNYSFNNTMLIALQKPDATYVAGFDRWKKDFERSVNKGEKGIKIFAPNLYKKKERQEKLDPDTGKPILDKDGKPVMEDVEVETLAFKVVNVFDVSQTSGKPLPTLGADELQGDVKDFESFFEIIKDISPVPIKFAEIDGSAKGFYHQIKKEITIKQDMSEIQTIKTAIHEIAHAKLHDKDLKKADISIPKKDRSTEEIEAESIAYTVCRHFGIDTSDYSFAYVASWSSGKDIPELKASLATIHGTATELIKQIEKKFRELEKERTVDKAVEVSENEQTNNVDQSDETVDLHNAKSQIEDKLRELEKERAVDKAIQIPDDVRENAKKALVVNLYGGPGIGKSTTALQLVAELKKRGINAEYVSEVAKELVYAKAFDKLDGTVENQKKLLSQQRDRLDMIAGNVDVAVTDCSLMLNAVYLAEKNSEYTADVLSQHNEYNNFNFFLERDTSVPFEQEGRIHNLEQSIEKDKEILSLLTDNNLEFERFDRNDITRMVNEITAKLPQKTIENIAPAVDKPVEVSENAQTNNVGQNDETVDLHNAKSQRNSNIIGNTPYKDIENKAYLKIQTSQLPTVEKYLEGANIPYSGRKTGKSTTITVSEKDYLQLCNYVNVLTGKTALAYRYLKVTSEELGKLEKKGIAVESKAGKDEGVFIIKFKCEDETIIKEALTSPQRQVR